MTLEPAAVAMFEQARDGWLEVGKPIPADTMTQIIGISQAESLKRIADALWGIEGTSGLLHLLNPLDVRNNY